MNTDKPVRRARRGLRRGQAMVEYSVVAHFLLVGGAVLMLPVIARLLDAMNIFYRSVYFVLSIGAV